MLRNAHILYEYEIEIYLKMYDASVKVKAIPVTGRGGP
jgi:hypothetical protein